MTLSEWMAKEGITDEKMAEKCGVDRVTISRVRRHVNRPSWALILKIRDLSGGAVTADDFICGGPEHFARGGETSAA